MATHDLRRHPDLLAELPPRGVGPIVLDERSGLPWIPSHFSRTFGTIARAAGWPDAVWSMDNRAGAVSEAFEAGAEPADVGRTATHTQPATTMPYNRGAVVQTGRVADLCAARHGKANRAEPERGNAREGRSTWIIASDGAQGRTGTPRTLIAKISIAYKLPGEVMYTGLVARSQARSFE